MQRLVIAVIKVGVLLETGNVVPAVNGRPYPVLARHVCSRGDARKPYPVAVPESWWGEGIRSGAYDEMILVWREEIALADNIACPDDGLLPGKCIVHMIVVLLEKSRFLFG